jgi:hypothetical protein
MSTEQTGHVQNVVNLGVIINRVTTFAAKYNPSRNEFKIPKLTELKASAETVLELANTAENANKKSIATRSSAFSGFDGLITRVINALRISGAMEQTVVQAEAIVRELRGKRASEKLTDEQIAAAKEEGKELKQNTLHNTTMDSKIDNFDKLVQFLITVPEYKPNEADLATAALTAKLSALKAANDQFNQTEAELNAARFQRDTILYTGVTGLFDIATGVKLYVKSAFGATSPQYKSISDLAFRKLG